MRHVNDSFILHDNGNDVIKVYRADADVVADHGRIEERFIEVMSTKKLKNLIEPRWVRSIGVKCESFNLAGEVKKDE